MSEESDDWDDEDWTDSYEEEYLEDEEIGSCPECGAEISTMAEVCPTCGYWLTERDRRMLDGGAAATSRIKVIGLVAVAIIAGMIFMGMMVSL